MCKRKWNNRCFVLCSLNEPTWRIRCHNMEQRVESKRFVDKVFGVDDAINVRFEAVNVRFEAVSVRFEAVSARTVLQGYESDFIKRLKLRRAIRRCSTVYVVNNTFSNMDASKLYEFAIRKRKRIVHEEDVL